MDYAFINWAKNNSIIAEGAKPADELSLLKLKYARADLDPSISEDTINYHYGKLAKAYVDRYNAGEGDPEFNKAGAFLHNILFAQYQIPTSSNEPDGTSKTFIEEHFGTFNKFKEEFLKVAMGIQGSGWVYLAKNGSIKTIKNHQIKSDIALLIDWWEHAWALDYQAAKDKYLENQWKIIDWSIVNDRLQGV
jgi:Fe-Mn family superoxide dismutase